MLLVGFTPVRALELTVSDGTDTNQYVPVYGNYLDANNGQEVQTLYSAADLAQLIGANISKITFYANTADPNWTENCTWSIGTTDVSDLSAGLIADGFTEVYSGPIIKPTGDQKLLSVTFSTPFTYTGGNLVIRFKTTKKSNYKQVLFYGQNLSTAVSRYQYNSANNTAKFSPKVTFEYTPGELADYAMNVAPTALTFPILATGSESSATVKVLNMGKNPFTLTASGLGEGSPFSVECPTEEIASLASATVTVKFAPTAGGQATGTLTLASSAGNLTQDIDLSGEGLDLSTYNYQETFSALTAETNYLPTYWGTNSTSSSTYSIYNTETNKGLACTSSNSSVLVSPCVKGDVVVFVKKTSTSSSASVAFAKCTPSGTSFTEGDAITPDAIEPALNTDDWSIVKFHVDEPTYIGIKLSYAAVNHFAAGELVPVKSAAIVSAKFTASKLVANAEGIVSLPVEINIKNTGTEAIAAADYTVQLKDKNKEAIGTSLNGVAIEAGQTATVSGTVTYSPDFAGASSLWTCFYASTSFNLDENKMVGTWTDVYNYLGKIRVRDEKNSIVNAAINLGTFQGDRTLTLYLSNEGTAPTELTGQTSLEGLTCTLTDTVTNQTVTLPYTLDVDKNLRLDIQFNTAGTYTGALLTLTHNGQDGSTSVEGSAARVPDNVWYEDFEAYQTTDVPAGWLKPDGSNWKVFERAPSGNYTPHSTDFNKRGLQNTNQDMTRIITPKLSVAEGQVLTFSAVGGTKNTSRVYVYYSADRTEWTRVKALSSNPAEGEEAMAYAPSKEMEIFTASIPAGEYYIAFEAGYSFVDDIFGFTKVDVAHDIYVNSLTADKSAMVNYPLNISLKATNLLATAEEAYKAELLLGDEVVATLEGTEAWTGAKTFDFTYTPHAAGELVFSARITAGDYTVTSATTSINVDAESAEQAVQVGTPGYWDSYVPISTKVYTGKSEIVYTADDLAGLAAGTAIKQIAVPYYCTSTSPSPAKLQIWLFNTDDAMSTSTAAFTDITGMENDSLYYLNESFEFKTGGSTTNYQWAKFDLSKPFVYTGSNLRLVIQTDMASRYTTSFGYEKKSTTSSRTKAYGVYAYASSVGGSLGTPKFFEYYYDNYWDTEYTPYMPVMQFISDKFVPVVSGSVSESTTGVALPDMEVTLTSGDVLYSGRTDAEGKYAISVLQADKEYALQASASADFAASAAEAVTFAEGNVEKNLTVDYTALKGATIVAATTYGSLSGDESTLALIGPWTAGNLYQLGKKLQDKPALTTLFLESVKLPTGENAPAAITFEKLNPNAVIYVKEEAANVPAWRNVVNNRVAATIQLTEQNAFAPAVAFTANEMTYTRSISEPIATLVLPFAVETIPTLGVEKPVVKAFVGHEENYVKFEAVSSIEANTPYLVEQDADGYADFEFSANNVSIDPEAAMVAVESDGFTFQGTFTPVDNEAATLHAFNGSEFTTSFLTIAPFEAYFTGGDEHPFTLTDPTAIRTLNGGGLEVYSIKQGLLVRANESTQVRLYSVDGRLIRSLELQEGENRISGLTEGIYLLDNHKVVVK